MAAETDKFVIANYALWAGDFEYFEELLRAFSPPHETPPVDGRAEDPVDFIRATGALRLRQFWQKRGEFRMLAGELAGQGMDLTDKPTVLETKHLRSTIWRIGEREFHFQGYLTDLAWQENFFENAHREAAKAGPPKKNIVPPQPAQNDLIELEDSEREPIRSLGVRWEIPADLFIQVELSDLGLLEGIGFWVKPGLPPHVEAITAPVMRLLTVLDPPTRK